MVHLRIVAPAARSKRALELLEATPTAINVVHLPGVARRPGGDLILCDIPREHTSLILEDLKALGIDRDGSIAVELIDTAISRAADTAERQAAGLPADAVIWEEVTERTSESAALSGVFLVFMVLAAVIASVGIFLDSAILIVGAMVVGPEFGPIAGFCVAVVQRRPHLAARSFVALAVGFPTAIGAVIVTSLIFKVTGVVPAEFSETSHSLSQTIASPDVFAVVVALCAGVAGMLSLTTAKSGALIGVLISVTTIPAAANAGVSLAYGDADGYGGSLAQLGLNVAALLVSGTLTLWVQRLLHARQRAQRDRSRAAAA